MNNYLRYISLGQFLHTNIHSSTLFCPLPGPVHLIGYVRILFAVPTINGTSEASSYIKFTGNQSANLIKFSKFIQVGTYGCIEKQVCSMFHLPMGKKRTNKAPAIISIVLIIVYVLD